MKDNPECIDCANSFVTDDDVLFCIVRCEIVADDDGCEDFN